MHPTQGRIQEEGGPEPTLFFSRPMVNPILSSHLIKYLFLVESPALFLIFLVQTSEPLFLSNLPGSAPTTSQVSKVDKPTRLNIAAKS